VDFHGDDDRRRQFLISILPLPGWHPLLAAALAARVGAKGGCRTLGSASGCWGSLARFIRFLSTVDRAPATPAMFTAAHMEAFYQHRCTTLTARGAQMDVRSIGRLLAEDSVREHIAAEALDYAARRHPSREPGDGGVPGYSDGELARLWSAARADAAAIQTRIETSERLLARFGEDPGSLTRDEAAFGQTLAVMAGTGEVPAPPGSVLYLHQRRVELAGHLFVTHKDLVPLLVLLGLLTGRNGETLKELPAKHRILEGRAVELEVTKRRRGPRRWFETVTWEIGPEGRELHNPGGLYLLLMRLTARSRAFSGADHLLCVWRNGLRSDTPPGPGEHHAPFVASLTGVQMRLSEWAASRGRPVMADPPPPKPETPDDEDGAQGRDDRRPRVLEVSFNRIKTSIDVRRTKQMGGHLPSAARTNSMPVLFKNYLSGDPTIIDWAHEVIGEAVVDAERSAIAAHERALASAGGELRVVPGPVNEESLQQAGLDPDTAKRANAGELDTGWSACTDHDHHPATGTQCRRSFLDCFHCGNCLVTHDHLPGLLALMEALNVRRQQMEEQQWWVRYGPAWAAIRRDILGKFSPQEREHAARDLPGDALLDLVEEPWEHP
jgi:hypothetical protein